MNLGGAEHTHKMHREIVATAACYFLGGILSLSGAPVLERGWENGRKWVGFWTNYPFKNTNRV